MIQSNISRSNISSMIMSSIWSNLEVWVAAIWFGVILVVGEGVEIGKILITGWGVGVGEILVLALGLRLTAIFVWIILVEWVEVEVWEILVWEILIVVKGVKVEVKLVGPILVAAVGAILVWLI